MNIMRLPRATPWVLRGYDVQSLAGIFIRLFLLLLLITACARHEPLTVNCSSQPFIIFLVDARQLDYSCNQAFFRTLVKHPSDGSKNSDVGHAWIYLSDNHTELEGGHSGELGLSCPKYFEGIMDYVEAGDPNPIRYLWEPLNDGHFQQGNGKHRPTYAITVNLTLQQYDEILCFIQNYEFSEYSLISQQCCSFVLQVAERVGLNLDASETMWIEPSLRIQGHSLQLWEDPYYAKLEFFSPEALQNSMIEAVQQGRAEYALHWYLKYKPCRRNLNDFMEDCYLLPIRLKRVMIFGRPIPIP